jgi:transcriptional regulator with XRE-family HTH domain
MQIHADGAKVRRLRDGRGWSQEHLAEVAGIGLRTVQRIENGEKAARESVMALAAAFDVEVMALTVDTEAEAARVVRDGKAKELAALRLSVLLHLAGYLFGMLVFAGISLGTGDAAVMKWPAIWWTVAMAGHGLVLAVVELATRHQRLART